MIAAVLIAAGMTVMAPAGAQAATTQLCQMQTTPVSGGIYTVQNNEFGSGASECITTNGSNDFTVANSSIDNATNGAPGAYTSIYQGCHWGNCTSGGLTATPIEVSALTSGVATTSWSTTQPGGSSAYDVAYDIWFNQTPTTTGQPNGTELMVWLNHNGSVQPYGSEVASGVTLGGHTYNIWYGKQSTWDTVTFDMTSAATSVSNLDIGTLAQDSVSLGYTKSSWYLIDVEAGFELWQGGAGLETNSFSVDLHGAAPTVPTLLGDLLAVQRLVRQLPGTGRADRHRQQPVQRLVAGLDVPREREDQRLVERHLHPVRGVGQRNQRLL